MLNISRMIRLFDLKCCGLNYFLLFLMAFFFCSEIYAKKIVDKKKYSERDFKEMVQKEVEKQLIRIGKIKIVGLAKELIKKENALEIKKLELEKKGEQLNINMIEFEKKIKDLEKRQTRFIGCLDEIESKKEKRVAHMVNVISGMKPLTAANLLSVQDSEITIKILGHLKPTKVSKIFNLMNMEISARLQKQYMTMKK